MPNNRPQRRNPNSDCDFMSERDTEYGVRLRFRDIVLMILHGDLLDEPGVIVLDEIL
mgnify:CR=1 FL=1